MWARYMDKFLCSILLFKIPEEQVVFSKPQLIREDLLFLR